MNKRLLKLCTEVYWSGITPRFLESASDEEIRLKASNEGLTMKQMLIVAKAYGIEAKEARNG